MNKRYLGDYGGVIMDLNYNKNSSFDLLLFKNYEDNEKRHQCDTLIINKDITNVNIKACLSDVKN